MSVTLHISETEKALCISLKVYIFRKDFRKQEEPVPSITYIPHYLKSNFDCISYNTLYGYAPATEVVPLPVLTYVELSQSQNWAWKTMCSHLSIHALGTGRKQF